MASRVALATRASLPSGLPSEFRIFASGNNPSSKGLTIFDAVAAQAVMSAYQRQGVDYTIDLEHLSLEGDSSRPDAADARGWFKLELRNGELWAVDVRWTPDGERRLREKTQRYISPAFYQDEKGRAVELINVALVAMPATYNAPALVAASKLSATERGRAYVALERVTAPHYGGANSRPIGVRFTCSQLDKIKARCRQLRMTPGEYVRLVTLANEINPEKVFASIAELLDMPKDTSPEVVMSALRELVSELEQTPGAEPTDEVAGAPPSAFGRYVLTPDEEKHTSRMTSEQRARFIELRAERAREQERVRRARAERRARER